MRPTLPRGILQKFCGFGLLLAACSHPPPPPPPGDPIPAEPDAKLGSMDAECGGLVTAVKTYGECPNLEDGGRAWARAVTENAEEAFAAGKKGEIDKPAEHAIAVACHKAADSIKAATMRCQAGPAPRGDY